MLQAARERVGDVEVRAFDGTNDDGAEIDTVTVAGQLVFIDAKIPAKTGGGL